MTQDKWQPIETAPHEDRVILGWFYEGTFVQEIAKYSTGERWDDGYCIRSNMSFHGRAEFWHPLPPPPGEQS